MAQWAIKLLEGEENGIWQGTPSWQSLAMSLYLKWGLLAGLPLWLGVALEIWTDKDAPMKVIALFVFIGWLLTFIVGYFKRHFTIYTVTTFRVNVRTGIFTHHHDDATYGKIQGVTFNQTLAGKVLGYGDVTIKTAASDDPNTPRNESIIELKGILNPEDRRNQIQKLQHESERDMRTRGFSADGH